MKTQRHDGWYFSLNQLFFLSIIAFQILNYKFEPQLSESSAHPRKRPTPKRHWHINTRNHIMSMVISSHPTYNLLLHSSFFFILANFSVGTQTSIFILNFHFVPGDRPAAFLIARPYHVCDNRLIIIVDFTLPSDRLQQLLARFPNFVLFYIFF